MMNVLVLSAIGAAAYADHLVISISLSRWITVFTSAREEHFKIAIHGPELENGSRVVRTYRPSDFEKHIRN
jgi:hypothetical protein